MFYSLNKNTASMIKFIFRRERFRVIVWLVSLVGFGLAVALTFSGMFESAAERQAMVPTMENPAMVAMVGPVYGADDYTVGAIMANEMLMFTIIAVAIMNIFFVSRYTRNEEERGRTEVIRSLPVGRLTGLNATMISAVIINLVLAVLTGLGLYLLGIDSMGLEGSMLYGAAIGVSGIFFAAVTAVFAQLCATSRGAIGYSAIAFAVFYLMRAMGDMDNETLARISPLGLALRTQIYVKDDWWPIPLILVISLVVICAAYYLNHIRDMGQGLLPAKPGRKTASFMLGSSIGLCWRLTRSSMIAWAAGVFALGASFGSIMGDMETFMNSNEAYRMLLPDVPGYSLTELFMTKLVSIFALVAAVPCIVAILKLKSEERQGHTEQLLARSVSRYKLMGGYLFIAIICSVVALAISIIGMWSASSAVMEVPISLRVLLKAQLIYLPAVWVMIGLAAFLIGIIPRATSVVWFYLTYSLIAVYLGDLLKMPGWSKKITPFGNIPEFPLEEINPGPLLVITAIAVVLTTAGMLLFRRRDMHG